MVDINGDILELETVRRLRKMLNEGHEEYDVTFSYAIFTALLCWVVERGRTQSYHDGQLQNFQLDNAARQFFGKLKNSPAAMMPWRLKFDTSYTGCLSDVKAPSDIRWRTIGLRECMADQFFVALRHAMAHGDGKNIFPWNDGLKLVGYSFKCEIRDQEYHRRLKERKVLWKGNIFLTRDDMVGLGCALADLFYQDMAVADPNDGGSQLREPTRKMRRA